MVQFARAAPPPAERPAIRLFPVLFDGADRNRKGGIPIVTTEASADSSPRPEFLALGAFYNAELEPWLDAVDGFKLQPAAGAAAPGGGA